MVSAETPTCSALSPVVIQCAKDLYAKSKNNPSHGGQISTLRSAPGHDDSATSGISKEGFDAFLEYLTSPEGNALGPLVVDTTYPISDYYISSSHNTYLSGNQLTSKGDINTYKDVLLRACRCVEIDVWDGEHPLSSDDEGEGDSQEGRSLKTLRRRFERGLSKFRGREATSSDDGAEQDQSETSKNLRASKSQASHSHRLEPRVLHGWTATKEVTFRGVCEVIGEYAFKTSDLPLIVSLEIHTSSEQQKVMVEIMEELWGPYLVDPVASEDINVPLPTLESLRKKILVKVKYSPPKSHKPQVSENSSEITHDHDSSEDEAETDTVKKGKIIDALSRMGVYTRSCHFKNFSQPEASIPTHVFALSESKLTELHEHSASALFQHNKKFLMRAYPKGLRVNSSNLAPEVFWRKGVQMVALNWQNVNAAMMLNEAMFAGTGGWCLKPVGYRSSHDATSPLSAAPRATLQLTLNILAAENITSKSERVKPYVRCEIHVEEEQERRQGAFPEGGRTKEGEIKASTEVGLGGSNPDFRQTLRFIDIEGVIPELTFVRLKVMDDDAFSRDNLIAWACFRLDRLRGGPRLIDLYDPDGIKNGGRMFVVIDKTLH